MAKKPEQDWFIGRTNYLMKQNTDRNQLFEATDKMVNLEWEMPTALKELGWAFKQTETLFRQIVGAATRILSDVKPTIHITPYDDSLEAKSLADSHERALGWFLAAASRRRPTTIVADVAESAVRYSEVALHAVFLPVQIKSAKKAGITDRRYDAITRRGPFVVTSHNPHNVYSRWSDLGVEEVVLVEKVDPHEVVDMYADLAKEVKEWIMVQDGDANLSGTLIDYNSYDWRYVAFVPGSDFLDSTGHLVTGAEPIEIIREEWKWSFLPWVSRYSGSGMENKSDYRRRTLLSDAYYANEFETMNRVKTLKFSDMLRYAGSARGVFKSDSRKSPDMDASTGDPYLHIYDDESITAVNPPQPDPNMMTLHNELRTDVQKSTLSEVLFSGDVPSGTAFATINLVTHSALAVLKPTRQLAQNALADLCELMLLWIHYSKEDVSAWSEGPDGKPTEYTINWKEIAPKNIYATVELHADVPTDRQQRMLTALNAVQGGLMDRTQAMEEIGVDDAEKTQTRIIQDQVFDNLMGVELENMRNMRSQQFLDMMMQRAMMQIQAQMNQGQGQGGAPGGPPQGPPVEGGMPQPGGPGNQPPGAPPTGMDSLSTPPNPNLQGTIPSELNPFATRELQRQGLDIGQGPSGPGF